MKTKVLMERTLNGYSIKQDSKNSYYCANDLIRIGNKFRAQNGLPLFNLQSWVNSNSTKEFIAELKNQFPDEEIFKTTKGKTGSTWIHPFLFLDMALAINPKFKVEVYSWIFDGLIKYRNDSGDSYKRMCGALWEVARNKSEFPKIIAKVAITIKNETQVSDWETATEEQLKFRDSIHDAIATLSDIVKDIDTCVEIAIKKARLKHEPALSHGNRA